jgi:hypothetical protein
VWCQDRPACRRANPRGYGPDRERANIPPIASATVPMKPAWPHDGVRRGRRPSRCTNRGPARRSPDHHPLGPNPQEPRPHLNYILAAYMASRYLTCSQGASRDRAESRAHSWRMGMPVCAYSCVIDAVNVAVVNAELRSHVRAGDVRAQPDRRLDATRPLTARDMAIVQIIQFGAGRYSHVGGARWH